MPTAPFRWALLWCVMALSLASCASRPTFRRTDYTSDSASDARCAAIGRAERLRILDEASPAKFPRTRYRKGSSHRPEVETDCSRFVHEIYRRAGLRYGYRPTESLADAREFDLLPESEGKPGDLMLFRGHVGVLGRDGRIISATLRRGRRPSSITSMDRSNFPSLRGGPLVLRYRCRPKTTLADTERENAARARARAKPNSKPPSGSRPKRIGTQASARTR